ncbi:MAG: hypothetical protein ACREEE_04830 [Dongiaceae bacterium]
MKTVKFEGVTRQFPDDATDEEIAAALEAGPTGVAATTNESSGIGKFTYVPVEAVSGIAGLPHAAAESIQDVYAPSIQWDELVAKYGDVPGIQQHKPYPYYPPDRRPPVSGAPEFLPTHEGARQFLTEDIGIPSVRAESGLGRFAQDIGVGMMQGGALGAVGGLRGAVSGALSGGGAVGASETAEALGASPPVQLAAGFLGGAAGGMRTGASRVKAPSTGDLKSQAQSAYDAAQSAGLVVTKDSMKQLADDIRAEAMAAGIDKTLHPRATAAMRRAKDFAKQPQTLEQVDTLRQVLKDAASSVDQGERRVAQMMVEKLDDHLDTLAPANIISGDAVLATDAIKKARALWHRMRKAELVEEAVSRAKLRTASTGSGGNIDNAIRQNIRQILDNPKKRRGFSQEERNLMEAVVKGGKVQNLLRLIGRLSPESSGPMTWAGLAGTAIHTPLVAAPIAGFIAKRIADNMTPKKAQRLLEAIQAGGSAKKGTSKAVIGSALKGGGIGMIADALSQITPAGQLPVQ